MDAKRTSVEENGSEEAELFVAIEICQKKLKQFYFSTWNYNLVNIDSS